VPEPRPWFPFYGKDWTSSTRNLSPEAKGCYIDLLAYAWDNGSIPLDEEERRLITGADRAQWRRVWSKLEARFAITEDGRLVNPRLERIRFEATSFQRAGQASAEARKRRNGTAQPNARPNDGPNVTPNDTPNEGPNAAPTKPELSQSQSHKKKTPRAPKGDWKSDPLFVRFYDAYPRRIAPEAAHRAFQRIAPDEDLVDAMLAALAWQRRQRDWTKDDGAFIPYPATWLNQRRWEDEHPDGALNGTLLDAPAGTPIGYWKPPSKPADGAR
jgi:uncharacterized protein YdaU (DUF1376 family)